MLKLQKSTAKHKDLAYLGPFLKSDPCLEKAFLPFFEQHPPLETLRVFISLCELLPAGKEDPDLVEAHRISIHFARLMMELHTGAQSHEDARSDLQNWLDQLVEDIPENREALKQLAIIYAQEFVGLCDPDPLPVILDLACALAGYHSTKEYIARETELLNATLNDLNLIDY